MNGGVIIMPRRKIILSHQYRDLDDPTGKKTLKV